MDTQDVDESASPFEALADDLEVSLECLRKLAGDCPTRRLGEKRKSFFFLAVLDNALQCWNAAEEYRTDCCEANDLPPGKRDTIEMMYHLVERAHVLAEFCDMACAVAMRSDEGAIEGLRAEALRLSHYVVDNLNGYADHSWPTEEVAARLRLLGTDTAGAYPDSPLRLVGDLAGERFYAFPDTRLLAEVLMRFIQRDAQEREEPQVAGFMAKLLMHLSMDKYGVERPSTFHDGKVIYMRKR